MSLWAQVTWHHVKHLIRALKDDRRSSLKVEGGGYVAHLCSWTNRFRNDLVLAIDLKSYNE